MLASTFDGFCFLWTKLPVLWSLYQDLTRSHLHSPGTSPLRPDCLISLYDGIFVLTLSSVKFNRPSFCCPLHSHPSSSSKCPDQWQLGLRLDTSQSITSLIPWHVIRSVAWARNYARYPVSCVELRIFQLYCQVEINVGIAQNKYITNTTPSILHFLQERHLPP